MRPEHKKRYRKMIVKLHLILALVFGLPILILALTGTILSFERELERWLHPNLYTVEKGDNRLPLQSLMTRVKEDFPDKTIRTIWLPQVAGEAIRFHTRDGIPLEIFVDPYTGELIGSRSLAKSITAVTRAIHTTFLLGKLGSRIAGITSLLFVATLGSGLLLWWSSRIRKKKRFLDIRISRGWFIANFDIHNVIGVLSALPLFILCITGAVFSFPEFFRPVIYRLTASDPPAPRPSNIHVPVQTGEINLDRMLALSQAAAPGTTATLIGLPGKKDHPLRVNRRAPGEAHYTGRTYIYLNPWTEQVIDLRSPARWSTGYQAIMINRVLHTGEIGGIPLRLFFFFTSFLSIPLVISGLIHWRGRKRNRVKSKQASAQKASAYPSNLKTLPKN